MGGGVGTTDSAIAGNRYRPVESVRQPRARPRLGRFRVDLGYVWFERDVVVTRRSFMAIPHGAAPQGLGVGVELGSRWVVASAGIVSDDEGRSWIPTDLTGDLGAHSGALVFEPGGTAAFGLLGASNGLDVPSLTVFAGRLLYSPDGMHWSSVSLADALGFDANIPTIAVGDRSAILEAGLRAPGVVAQRFWLVTLGP